MPSSIIDVSSSQGNPDNIDWNAVSGSGVTDVIIRLSLGYGDLDATAIKNAANAAAAGLNVSYYHFAYPDTRWGPLVGGVPTGPGTVTSDAIAEATYFWSSIGNNNLPGPKWLAVDFEKYSYNPPTDSPLGPADYLQWAQTFINTVKQVSGMPCMIYSYPDYLNTHLPAGHNLGPNFLWISNTGVAAPTLPAGWNTWFMWQYATAQVPGITANVVDQNKLNDQAVAMNTGD
jgi:lysozyme